MKTLFSSSGYFPPFKVTMLIVAAAFYPIAG